MFFYFFKYNIINWNINIQIIFYHVKINSENKKKGGERRSNKKKINTYLQLISVSSIYLFRIIPTRSLIKIFQWTRHWLVYLYFSRSAGSIGARSAPSTPLQVSPGAQQAGQQSISGSQLTVTSANNSQPPRSPSHATLRCNDRWVHDLSASRFHLSRVNRSYYDS